MNQSTRILFVAIGVCLAIYAVLSVAFVCEVYDTEEDLRHIQYRNVAYLRALIKQSDKRIDQLENSTPVTKPTIPAEPSKPAPDCPSGPSDPTDGDGVPPVGEAIPTLYTLRTYQDLLGVFDARGQLLKVINVYCDALPAADRAVLQKGLSFTNQEDLLRVLNAYV